MKSNAPALIRLATAEARLLAALCDPAVIRALRRAHPATARLVERYQAEARAYRGPRRREAAK